MAGRRQPGIQDAYKPAGTVSIGGATFSAPQYNQPFSMSNVGKKAKPKKGPTLGDAAGATGGYIANELLGFDDFGWAFKNAQQGNFLESAKSFGAGVLELGLTVGGFFTGGGTAAAGAAVKAGGKAVVREGLEQVSKGTLKGSGGKAVSKYDNISARATEAATKGVNSVKGGGKSYDPSSIRAAENIRPVKPSSGGYSPTATLQRTTTKPEIQPLRIKPLEPTRVKPVETAPKPHKQVLPKKDVQAKPSTTVDDVPMPKRKARPGGLLGLQLVGQVSSSPDLDVQRIPTPYENPRPQVNPQVQADPKPDSSTPKKVVTDLVPRKYDPDNGSMGTAASDVTIPYVY